MNSKVKAVVVLALVYIVAAFVLMFVFGISDANPCLTPERPHQVLLRDGSIGCLSDAGLDVAKALSKARRER